MSAASEQSGSTVRVQGELDLSNAHKLTAAITRASRSGSGAVIVDLGDCTFIDSAGMAAILRGAKQLDAAGRRLSVACAHPEIRRLLELTAIDRSVAVIDTVPEAES